MTARWTFDLLGVVAWALAAGWLVLRTGQTGAARALAVLPLLVFFPGYALLSALYPRGRADENDRRLGPAERVALSVALSLGVVPLLVFGLNFTVGIYTRPIVLAVSGVTVGFAALALLRRALVADADRFAPGDRLARGVEDAMPGGVFTLLLVGSLMLLAASGTFAALEPPDSESFTELYLLAENGSGDLTTAAVDEAAAEGEPITIAVQSHEDRRLEYTVVVLGQTVDDGSVADERTLERQRFEVSPGATAHLEYGVPDDAGDRLVVRLYRGETAGTPYRSNQVWLE